MSLNLSIEDLVFVQNHLNKLFIHFGEGNCRVKGDPASLLLAEVDVGRFLIQSDPDALQLLLQQIPGETAKL